MNDVESCSVCGRTILAGEQTRAYLTPEGERRHVCDLCRDRAERVGWVWEEIAPTLPPETGRRRGGLTSLLRGVARRREAREADPPDDFDEAHHFPEEPPDPPPAPEPDPPVVEEEVAPPAADSRPEDAGPPPPRPSPDPAAPGAGIGRTLSPAESRMSRIEGAIDRFNTSEQSVMIAGLARTLGGPWVSVGSGSPDEVRITVAWELSWYQWGVDLADEMRPVYELGKGGELSELDAPAKQWNARMEDSGRIELGVVPLGGPTA